MKLKLKKGWYHPKYAAADLCSAGVYQWSIEGVGVYVGKAKVLRTRLPAYGRNVLAMLLEKPWHGNPAEQYRLIHHELLNAYRAGTPVTVSILETCDPADRAALERVWIRVRREEAENGGPKVLNSN